MRTHTVYLAFDAAKRQELRSAAWDGAANRLPTVRRSRTVKGPRGWLLRPWASRFVVVRLAGIPSNDDPNGVFGVSGNRFAILV